MDSTLTGCKNVDIDLQFILDSSSSVNLNSKHNFRHGKDFIKNVSDTFNLESGNVRVGVLTYSTGVHTNQEIRMGIVNSLAELGRQVDALRYTGGDTHTGAALR